MDGDDLAGLEAERGALVAAAADATERFVA